MPWLSSLYSVVGEWSKSVSQAVSDGTREDRPLPSRVIRTLLGVRIVQP